MDIDSNYRVTNHPNKDFIPFEIDYLQSFTLLHKLLWDKRELVNSKIYSTINVQVPNFILSQEEGWDPEIPHYSETPSQITQLSVEDIFLEYEANYGNSGMKARHLLPCGARQLLIREAYKETLAMVKTYEAERVGDMKRVKLPDGTFKSIQDFSSRQATDKGYVISGHPGIGKTWFLSYLLVERLLSGFPTVFQVQHGNTVDMHYFFNESGVDILNTKSVRKIAQESRIWALVDQQPIGLAADLNRIEWLFIITSSPNVKTLKTIAKKHGITETYYMPVWGWSEIVAAA